MKKLTKTQAIDKNGLVWDKNSIKELVGRNPVAAVRALEILYNRQTEAEKQVEQTVIHNTIGFTGADAEILTSIYKQYKKFNKISEKQLAIVQKKMKKYWSQILDHMRMSVPQVIQTEMRFVQSTTMEKK